MSFKKILSSIAILTITIPIALSVTACNTTKPKNNINDLNQMIKIRNLNPIIMEHDNPTKAEILFALKSNNPETDILTVDDFDFQNHPSSTTATIIGQGQYHGQVTLKYYKKAKTGVIEKIVTAEPQGDVYANTTKHQLGFYHSQFTPTGIFVNIGAEITITWTQQNSEPFSIFIGQWGSYKDLNSGQDISPKEYVITETTRTITSEIQGMLYVTNKSNYNMYLVAISVKSSGINVPTFIVNQTTNQEFHNVLQKNHDAPFVEIISANFIGTFQMTLAKSLWLDKNPDTYNITELFHNLDHLYELSNTVSGLNLNYDGVAQKFHNRMHITNPDTGAGYASATNYHITFQHATGADTQLFSDPDYNWGIWHEMGHTYQNPNYEWKGLTEVTVNINSLWIERELGFDCRLITDHRDQEIKNFITSSDPNKDFNQQNVWVKLGMFWQLDQAYGKWFWPTLNQTYRLLDSKLLPNLDEAKIQLFIQMTSKLVNQNLIPFFEKWGINVDETTTKIVNKYAPLTKDIWNNLLDKQYNKNAIIEHELPKYNPTQGVQIKNKIQQISVGNEHSVAIKNHVILQNNQTIIANYGINYATTSFFSDNSGIEFIVAEPGKTPNKYELPTTLNFDNSILLQGIGYGLGQYRATINLNRQNRTFFIGYNDNEFHNYYHNYNYCGITIIDTTGKTLFDKTAQGQDSAAVFAEMNNIQYQEGYQINFWLAENRYQYYEPSQEWIRPPATNNKIQTYYVHNNQLLPLK